MATATAEKNQAVHDAFSKAPDVGEKIDLIIFAIADLGSEALGKRMLEFLEERRTPAVEENEDPDEAANRELQERQDKEAKKSK
jgi:hypothetical protein